MAKGLIVDISSSYWLWEFCEIGDQRGTDYLRKTSLASGYSDFETGSRELEAHLE